MPSDAPSPLDPVHDPLAAAEPDGGSSLEDGLALCLSGGGYRAMLFHVGSLWRLNDAGLLPELKRVSSVSGGSITAGVLALAWPNLAFGGNGVSLSFDDLIVRPVRRLAGRTIDAGAIVSGIFLPGSIGEKVANAYRKYLFGSATLQDLPDDARGPRFVFNATNVQSGVLWRFSRPYMGDYRVGLIRQPSLPLATAVAASSAFPPVLSPLTVDLDPADFDDTTGTDLTDEAYRDEIELSDGGVYDNLGLETVWKRYTRVLVSDGGGQMAPDPDPKHDWAQHAYRVLNIIDNQVRGLRKRQTIGAFRDASDPHTGAFWGIRTDIADYGLSDALPCPHPQTLRLAETKTRLKALSDDHQDRLINWGYAVTDAALRAHVDASLPRGAFPYPASGVG